MVARQEFPRVINEMMTVRLVSMWSLWRRRWVFGSPLIRHHLANPLISLNRAWLGSAQVGCSWSVIWSVMLLGILAGLPLPEPAPPCTQSRWVLLYSDRAMDGPADAYLMGLMVLACPADSMALYQPLRTPQAHPRGRLPWGVAGVSSMALTRDGGFGTVNRL
jgi:hypothetical protein